MPRFAEVEGFPKPLEFPDETTDEVMDSAVRQAVQEHTRRQTEAGAARKAARQELADQARQAAQTGITPTSAMGVGEIVPPGGSQGPTAGPPTLTEDPLEALSAGAFPATGFEEYHARDPLAAGIARHAPGVLAGTAAGMALGPQAGLMTRAGVQSGVTALIEALAGGIAGEDPLAAGGKGLLYGLLGEVGGTAASKAVAPLTKGVTAAGKRLIEKVRPAGGVVTPGQAGEGAIRDLLENIASGIGGGSRMRRTYRNTEEIADNLVWNVRRDFPESNKAQLDALYDAAFGAPTGGGGRLGDELIGTGDLTSLTAMLKTKHPADPGVTRITRMVGKYIQSAGRADEAIQFDAAHSLRGAINSWIREHPLDPVKTGVGRGAATKVSAALDSLLERTAQTTGGDTAVTAWRTADAARRAVGAGEQVEELLMGVRKAKGKWGEYGKEMLDGRSLANKLAGMKPKDIGLTPEQFGTLSEFSQALAQAQSRDPEGAGRVMVQLLQAGWVRSGLVAAGGAMAGGAVGGKEGAGVGALAGLSAPFVLSRVLTNPTMAKWLTTGLGGPTAQARAKAMGLLTTQLLARAAMGGSEKQLYNPPWEMTVAP